MGGGTGDGVSSKFKRIARRIFLGTCGFLCGDQHSGGSLDTAAMCDYSPTYSPPPVNVNSGLYCRKNPSEMLGSGNSVSSPCSKQTMCPICLEPLNYSSGGTSGQAIFTAQCSHAFHFTCISSNVRHGSITCPICRAQWTQLPRNLYIRSATPSNKADPILQILDESIANSRFHRQSFLRTARYDDDDPVDPDRMCDQPRLQFFLTGPWTLPNVESRSGSCHCSGSSSMGGGSPLVAPDFSGDARFPWSPVSAVTGTYLNLRLGYQPSTDLVLVACPDGPHLRMMKQAMALVVFDLRPEDRLAIVTYSSAAARVFPLRRMTPFGKKAALQVIDRLFYIGQTDPAEGLRKGAKILDDRIHVNPKSCILHLTNATAATSHHEGFVVEDDRIAVHRFHLGSGPSTGLLMHEFEEFLRNVLSGAVQDVSLRIRKEGSGFGSRAIRIRELRGGDERRILIDGGDDDDECSWPVEVSYSFVDGGRVRTGEAVVGFGEKGDGNDDVEEEVAAAAVESRRRSSGEKWEFHHHDPFMARRWAKHLHGHRL